MGQQILFIGLDVDDKNFHGYAILDGAQSGTAFKTKASSKDLAKVIEKLRVDGSTVHICYESTYSGYHLCRDLRKAGFECTIIAAGLIPEISGSRVKNDRLDAEKLARLFSKGLLTAVHVPEFEDEIDRTLVRSRTYLMEQLKSLRRHVIAVSKQIGWNYRGTSEKKAAYWTEMHKQWLRQQTRSAPDSVRINFQLLLSQLDSLESHIDEYAEQIQKISVSKKYKDRVQALSCYRGISTLTAMVLVTELGDIKRFPHPNKLVSYVGMDIAEYSSGGKERRFSMTKMGNRHVRKILTEAVQSANKIPVLSKELKKRRLGSTVHQQEIADRCMRRLHSKSVNLMYKSKPVNKIKSACAREMIGFIWESLNLVS